MNKTLLRLITITLLLNTTPLHAAVIKIATLSPDGTSWMKKMRLAAKDIARLTSNRVKIKYYPGGVMGDENAILRKMRINQLQGAAVTSGSLTRYYKDANIYGLPFLFKSQAEVNYVRKHFDNTIIEGLKKKGMISFGLAESGFAYILSKVPNRGVTDLRKQKVWIPDTASARDAVKAFNINPIPLPLSDVLAGLQTRLIDTIAAPPIATIALQWHTQVKFLTDMPLSYGWGTLVVSQKALKKLKKTDNEIVHKVMSDTFKQINSENQKDNIEALAALEKQGITFVKPNATQLAEWENLAKKSNLLQIKNGFNSKEKFDFINKLITASNKQ